MVRSISEQRRYRRPVPAEGFVRYLGKTDCSPGRQPQVGVLCACGFEAVDSRNCLSVGLSHRFVGRDPIRGVAADWR